MNPFLLRNLVFPAYHMLKGTKVIEKIAELKKNQWISEEELTRLQEIKLNRLLVYAYQHVPYYREKFRETGIDIEILHHPECFCQIPLLTKKEINENREKMISTEMSKNRLIANSTSGSTGEALYFYNDMQSWAYRSATVIRNQEAIGIKQGDRSVRLWGAPMDLKTAATLRGKLHAWANNIMFLSSYELSDRKLEIYKKKLNIFRPKFLVSYPGPLAVFSEYLIKQDNKIRSINAIISSAETLFSWQKDLIENAFSCPVYNRYGCREFGEIAQECEKREGLHINSDRVFIEILNNDLLPVERGKSGEIIVTDLDNYGMPFIRYRIGDLASFKNEMCSCGRSLPLLDQVEGRTLEVVRGPNGNRLGGTFWTLLFRSKPGIKSFQVIQNKIEEITVKYVRDPEVGSIDIITFEKSIKDKCGKSLSVNFEEVPYIPKTFSGKTKIVISKVNDPC